MPNKVHDFYKEFVNISVNSVMRNSYCYCRTRIPTKKTVTQYTIALEEAVPELLTGGDSQLIIDILQDAKDHNKWPTKYESYLVDIPIFGKYKATGMLSYMNNTLKVMIQLGFMQITIKTEDVCFKRISKKGNLDENIMLRIFEIQEVLKTLKRIKERK